MYSSANVHLFGARTLQGLAQGYCSDNMLIGQYIAPIVQVECRTGSIIRFGKEAFSVQDTRRAYSATVQTVSSKFSADTYTLESHALAYTIPVEILEASNCLNCANQSAIDLRQIELNNITSRLNRGHEFDVIKLVTDPATYETANYGATITGIVPGPNLAWNAAGSTPIKDVLALQSIIRRSVGCRPNAIVLGAGTFELLITHPDIVSRVQYTTIESITTDVLARYFNVKSVVVADGLYTDPSGNLTNMMPEYSMLVFYSPAAGEKNVALAPNAGYSMATPSSFFTYMMKGGTQTTAEVYYDMTATPFANVVRSVISMEYSVQGVSLGATNKVNSAAFILDVTA